MAADILKRRMSLVILWPEDELRWKREELKNEETIKSADLLSDWK